MEKNGEETDFDRFWNAYPARKGDRAKQPAKTLFDKIIKSGIPPDDIIYGAMRYAALESEKIGTEFIMQAQRWLRNKRWLDFTVVEAKITESVTRATTTRYFVKEGTPQWSAWQSHLRKTTGKGTPCVNFGWWFPSESPPHE